MRLKTRKATIKDAEQILKLVKKLYSKSSPKTIKNWEKNYVRLIKATLIVRCNKKIIAFITFAHRKNAVYINDLYVLPDYRRKGIATKFLKKIDYLRKKLKKKYLMVNNRKKDKNAFKLYKNFGFQVYNNKKSLKMRR